MGRRMIPVILPPRRALLADATGQRCHYCGVILAVGSVELAESVRASVDHRIPKCRGGKEEADNLVLADFLCNRLKGDMTETEFLFFCATGRLAATYVEWLGMRRKRANSRFENARFEKIARRHAIGGTGGTA